MSCKKDFSVKKEDCVCNKCKNKEMIDTEQGYNNEERNVTSEENPDPKSNFYECDMLNDLKYITSRLRVVNGKLSILSIQTDYIEHKRKPLPSNRITFIPTNV